MLCTSLRKLQLRIDVCDGKCFTSHCEHKNLSVFLEMLVEDNFDPRVSLFIKQRSNSFPDIGDGFMAIKKKYEGRVESFLTGIIILKVLHN